jgi:hypothetical protein
MTRGDLVDAGRRQHIAPTSSLLLRPRPQELSRDDVAYINNVDGAVMEADEDNRCDSQFGFCGFFARRGRIVAEAVEPSAHAD